MLSFIFSIFVMSFSDSSPQKIPKSKEKIEKFTKVPAGKEIQKELSKVLGREIDINPLYDLETGDEDRECIQFEIEQYGETDQLQEDFVSLIDNYLKHTIGENNYKINQNVD